MKLPKSATRGGPGSLDRVLSYDLRHDFCSKLVQSGVDLYTVKELAGHKDITTTQRYAHLSKAKLKEAVAVLEKLS